MNGWSFVGRTDQGPVFVGPYGNELPDDPFDLASWFTYPDVDLDAIDWTDEMRKLPGQFTQLLCFPGSPDQRIIAQAVRELTDALITKNERRNAQ